MSNLVIGSIRNVPVEFALTSEVRKNRDGSPAAPDCSIKLLVSIRCNCSFSMIFWELVSITGFSGHFVSGDLGV